MNDNFGCVTAYKIDKFIPSDSHCYDNLHREIKKRQIQRRSPVDVAKYLLKQGIKANLDYALREAEFYLDTNAHEGGDFNFRYAENIPKVCGRQVIWFEGDESGNNYLKKVECRKQWCPVCGGKGGKIHQTRMHSLLNRIDPDKYNARQFVFTVPKELREIFRSREKLNELDSMAKDVICKYFGVPAYDKKGHIKKYLMDKPAISYFHLFGDEEPGIFKPHINIHILEPKKTILKLSESFLDSIRKSWLKKLKKYSTDIQAVDVQYSFVTKKGKLIHKLKYMCRPWSKENYDSIIDESLKRLLVLDLSGFQYFRYWGQLSNRTYKDEMDLSEIQKEYESKINEKLIPIFWAPFNFESYKNRLVEIDEGFYLLKKEGFKNESKEVEKIKSNE